MAQHRNVRWPRLDDGEGLEPTAIFLHARDIVATARAAVAGGPPRGLSPAMMERALVSRMLHELETPVRRAPHVRPRRLPPPLPKPNPFLVPLGPGDPPPPWAVRRAHSETRTTLAASPYEEGRSIVPLLLFLAFGSAAFALTAEPALLAEILARAARAATAIMSWAATW